MFWKLLLLLTLVPLAELSLLILLGWVSHPLVSIGVVVVTGIAGAILLRREGLRTWRRVQQELSQGVMPADALLDAMLILFAGALLLTPGVLTDAAAVSLLIPPLRRLVKAWLVAWFKRRVDVRVDLSGQSFGGRTEVIDSYVVERSEEDVDEP